MSEPRTTIIIEAKDATSIAAFLRALALTVETSAERVLDGEAHALSVGPFGGDVKGAIKVSQ